MPLVRVDHRGAKYSVHLPKSFPGFARVKAKELKREQRVALWLTGKWELGCDAESGLFKETMEDIVRKACKERWGKDNLPGKKKRK